MHCKYLLRQCHSEFYYAIGRIVTYIFRKHLQFVDFWIYRNFEAVRYDANRIPSKICSRKSCSMTICGDSKSIVDMSVMECNRLIWFIRCEFCRNVTKKAKFYTLSLREKENVSIKSATDFADNFTEE